MRKARPQYLKILIADDHELIRAGMRQLMDDLAGTVEVMEANSLEGALSVIDPAATPDLMLVDLMMPGMGDGITGIRRIRDAVPDVPLVVLSVKDHPTEVRRAIEAGAFGYIPKASTAEVMQIAIDLVLAGGIYIPPDILGQDRPEPERRGPAVHETAMARLTPRQRDILALVADGLTNKQVARSLGVSAGTVKVHLAQILRTLGVQNRTQAVALAVGAKRRPEGGRGPVARD